MSTTKEFAFGDRVVVTYPWYLAGTGTVYAVEVRKGKERLIYVTLASGSGVAFLVRHVKHAVLDVTTKRLGRVAHWRSNQITNSYKVLGTVRKNSMGYFTWKATRFLNPMGDRSFTGAATTEVVARRALEKLVNSLGYRIEK